jgi:hypothetical protein
MGVRRRPTPTRCCCCCWLGHFKRKFAYLLFKHILTDRERAAGNARRRGICLAFCSVKEMGFVIVFFLKWRENGRDNCSEEHYFQKTFYCYRSSHKLNVVPKKYKVFWNGGINVFVSTFLVTYFVCRPFEIKTSLACEEHTKDHLS